MKIEEVYVSKRLETLLAKLCTRADHRDDLKQELFITLLSLPKEKWDKIVIDNAIWVFIYTIVKNLYHSSSSPFYKKYRVRVQGKGVGGKFGEMVNDVDANTIQSIDIDNGVFYVIEEVEMFLDHNVHWYDGHLFRCAYLHTILPNGDIREPMSYRDIQDMHTMCGLKISKTCVHRNVVATKKKLVEHLKNKKMI